MTAGTSQQRRHRRRMPRVLAAIGTCAIGLAAAAPPAVAAQPAPEQWYLDPMQAEAMWKVSTGKGVKVAVIGFGVSASTPSLQGQVLPGKDITKNGAGTETDDRDGQGTTTAELIAGTGNGGGIRGLAPGSKIVPYRVPVRSLKEPAPLRDPVHAAIKAAADSDAKIINISLVSDHVLGSSVMEEDVYQYAAKKGKLVIAGVGDNAKTGNKAQYPAARGSVVGVAAMGPDGKVADFSHRGKDVNLTAPGVKVPRWCDATFKKYCEGQGTVAAAALASAAAALVWSQHPDWTGAQVLRVLYDTADRSWGMKQDNPNFGFGVIRPRAVVLEGKGNPGKADSNADAVFVWPVFRYEPVDTASPSPAQTKPALATSSQVADTGNSTNTPFLVGGIAAALALAAGAAVVIRRRRTP
ncbi:S8 family serine peptidase [Streptomyces sp. NPDC004111]|uniref:S8 family serine peptidase n=1 Tax=Streptomyces sp. NPDC004111 TaxID=3364690 RepID=UPI003685C98E